VDAVDGEYRDKLAKLSFCLILASTSPRRAELLSHLGVPFEVKSSHVVESITAGENPRATVERLALAKARAVATEIASLSGSSETSLLVLGADTIVVDGSRSVGKPGNALEAVALLGALKGKGHQVITGVALVNAMTAEFAVRSETTRVKLRDMTDEEIVRYVASGDPLDKAGAYGIQNREFEPVEAVDGCYTNVVGLPLCVVAEMIAERVGAITTPRDSGRCDCDRLANWTP
jgi:MAF protein